MPHVVNDSGTLRYRPRGLGRCSGLSEATAVKSDTGERRLVCDGAGRRFSAGGRGEHPLHLFRLRDAAIVRQNQDMSIKLYAGNWRAMSLNQVA